MLNATPAPQSESHRYADEPRLLRGSGPDLGPLATAFPYEKRTLIHVLRNQVKQRGDDTRLTFDGSETLTFRQAEEGAHRFALAAWAAGFKQPRVALLLRNQAEFVPAFFGAQIGGGFAAPLNPESRGMLLTGLLDRCQAEILVIRADLLDVLRTVPSLGQVALILVSGHHEDESSVQGVPIQSFNAWYMDHAPTPSSDFPRPDDLAALVFTSGTSGGSKAVMWTHHYQYLSSATISDSLGHTATDVLSTPLQMCHIAGLQNCANSALHVGCTAHLKSTFSASRWWDEIAEDDATFAMLMGPMAGMVLDRVRHAPPHRLGKVYMLPQPARRIEFEQRYRTTVLWQGWGMTEIFPHVPTATRLEGVPADTIGPPPAWVDYGVVDENDRLLAPGQLGQMVYRPLLPNAMASGYYGDPEATNKAFRNFMFHTGDLGYYDQRGLIHFVSRDQDVIRRQGENVSAAEWEQVVQEYPTIADAAAYAVPAALGEHEVKLDVIARTEGDLVLQP